MSFFPFGVLDGKCWAIVSIPDHCLPFYLTFHVDVKAYFLRKFRKISICHLLVVNVKLIHESIVKKPETFANISITASLQFSQSFYFAQTLGGVYRLE